MADILTDVRVSRVWPARPGISPRRPARDRARPRRRLTPPASAGVRGPRRRPRRINVEHAVRRAGGAFAEVSARRPPRESPRAAQHVAVARGAARARARAAKNRRARAVDAERGPRAQLWEASLESDVLGVRSRRSHDRLRK